MRETRSKAYDFQMPQISTNTFAYSAINEGNRLENSIKGRVNLG